MAPQPDSSANARSARRRRRRRVSPIAVVVALALTAGSAGLFVATSKMVETEEADTLRRRSTVVANNVGSRLAQVRIVFRSLAMVVPADPSYETFKADARNVVSPTAFSAVAIISTTTPTPTVIAGAGTLADGQVVEPGVARAVQSLSIAEPMVTTGVLGSGGDRRVGMALGPPTTPQGTVIYTELPLRSGDSPLSNLIFGDDDSIDSAIYAGEPAAANLLFSTTEAEPLTGETQTQSIDVGVNSWTLVSRARYPLADPLSRATPWLLLAGGVLAGLLVGALIEVISRRRDDALAVAEERAEENLSILDAAQEAFYRVDRDGTLLAWSGQSEQLFGWRAEEVLGRRVFDVLTPEDRREADQELFESFSAESDATTPMGRFETDVVCKGGGRVPVEAVVWVTERHDGTAFSFMMHDITERRQAADELAAAHERALDTSRMKSEFLATMSHEIRTPMNAVIGMTGLLLRTDLDDEQREYAETVRNSAESLLGVINDILDFSKIEAGKLELELLDFEVATAVEESVDLLAEPAHAKGLELVVSIEPDVPRVVRGDAGRLRQVLVNLVSNAVKFTEQGEIVVDCRVGGRQDGRVELRFEVRDTGIGIAAEHQPRLFASFTQADSSTTRRFGGTGLGLAIAAQLTELMGGRIGVDSSPGEGSCFWFTVEVGESPADVALPRPSRALERTRVLIVDDNATNRTILERTLAGWGMRTATAATAGEAIDRMDGVAAGDAFDVVLLDHHLPDRTGLEAAPHLAAAGGWDSARILLLTSTGEHLEREALARAGIAGSLAKPVRQLVLRDRIVALLDGGRQTVAAAVPGHGDRSVPGGARVLVAEDNPVNQRVAARMLEKLGCTVDVAATGREAIEAVGRCSYSLVLMDCQMPEMDGYEATREIRRLEGSRRHTPIVALTAAAMAGERERTLEAGMDDYVAKPVRFDELAEAVTRWSAEGDHRGGDRSRPEATSTAPEGLDLTTLVELREVIEPGAEGEFLGLVEEFVTGAFEQLAAIDEAMAAADAAAVGRAAHRLAGSARVFGARDIAERCRRIERRVTAGDVAGVAAEVAELAHVVRRDAPLIREFARST